MAEILTSLLGPAVEELGSSIVAAIKRPFNYLCCFNSNIQKLRDEAEKLENARIGLQMQVDAAERNTEVIVPEVQTWLTNASNQINIIEIENEIPNARRGFLSMKSRYSTSRKARKATKAMKELRDGCKFNLISQPAPPPSMEPLPSRPTYEFQSRKQIEDDIMEALRDDKVNILGICGMGGVGKTTMAERIMDRVREEHLFDEVLMAVVKQPIDIFNIQQEIAELLGLKLHVETLTGRAHQLRVRLMGKKRVVIVLDNVWQRLKLEDLGIPCQNECRILLTSRNRDVLNKMDAQMIFAVETLSEAESWLLFREKVWTCKDDLNLLSIAKQVVDECKGLPLALTTVGMTLKNNKSQRIWEDALQQLQRSNPVVMPDVLPQVYEPIKLSYDFLDNEQARSLFLLCCLFPEGYNIHLEYMTFYGMGLRMLEGIRNVEEARNRVCALFEVLKSRSLLLNGCDENHVKMHDIVRDVAIFIASKEGRLNLDFNSIDYSREQPCFNCTWISVVGKETIELPVKLSFPSLRLLVINNSIGKGQLQISDDHSLFKGMKELNVMFLIGISFGSLPQTLKLLQNLRTLYLEDCTSLETISIVGELLSLEFLICRSCHEIAELPAEIGELNRLKLLEVSHCRSLKRIAPGVISNLGQLEELKIIGSFRRWETKAKGKEKDNASLDELELLSNLTNLEIEIEDATLAAEEISLPTKIVKYGIKLGVSGWVDIGVHEKSLHLHLPKEMITLGKWIHVLLRSTEYLYVGGDSSVHLDLTQAQNTKMFTYEYCSTVNILSTKAIGISPLLESLKLSKLFNLREICSDSNSIPNASNPFANLKELTLHELTSLLHIWKSPQQNISLCNLTSINISHCYKLRRLFPLAMANDCLLQLENLNIRDCDMMEEVFSNEKNERDGYRCHLTFPKLKRVDLQYMHRLTTLCKGSESIKFPVLSTISVHECHKLQSLSCTWDYPNLASHDDDSFHIFCNPKVVFGTLKEFIVSKQRNISNIWCRQIPLDFFNQLEKLEINGCNGLRSIFSSSVAENLVNLKYLAIGSCSKIVNVIEDDEKLNEKPALLFRSLQILELNILYNLQRFCKCKCDLNLPSLKIVQIYGCPVLEFLTMGSVTTPNLKSILIDNKETNVGDLNAAIQLHFEAEHGKGKIEEK